MSGPTVQFEKAARNHPNVTNVLAQPKGSSVHFVTKKRIETMITRKSLIVGLAVASTALYQCTLDHKNTDGSRKNQSNSPNFITGIQLDSLEGVWWSKDEHRHALFYIVDDSLYYTEDQLSPYFVNIDSGNLVLSRDSSNFKFQIWEFSGDSLVLLRPEFNEYTRLYRTSKD